MLLEQLHTKMVKQGKLWLLGFAVLLWLTYFMGVKKTFIAYYQKQVIEQQLQEYNRWQSKQPRTSTLPRKTIGVGAVQATLFSRLTNIANELKVTVSNIEEPHSYTQSGMEINLYKIECRGRFQSLMKMIYQFESNFKEGKVLGYAFEKKHDLKTKKSDLFVVFWVQSLGETAEKN